MKAIEGGAENGEDLHYCETIFGNRFGLAVIRGRGQFPLKTLFG
jgi:hypothetical protein